MLATVLDYADLEEVLSFMEGKARELGLEGVAVVDVYPRVADGEPIRHSVLYVREIGNFVITDQEGKYNCYGVALMKVAVCRRSRQPSGFPSDDQQILEGESAYRGAVYLEHLLTDAVIAFSGGTQEQDLMVVLEGAARLKRVLDWEIKYQARECQSTGLLSTPKALSAGPRMRGPGPFVVYIGHKLYTPKYETTHSHRRPTYWPTSFRTLCWFS